MTDVYIFLGGACLLMVIVCLIVREQTEGRIRQLRAHVLGLRTEEKRLAERHSQLEEMEAQIREAMLRTERQEAIYEQEFAAAAAKLDQLYVRVRGESLPADTGPRARDDDEE